MLQDFGIVPPFELQALLETYLTDDLAHAIIDAIARLTISEFECISESDELCEYVNEFNRRIDLYSIVYQMLLDMGIFGFTVPEIVGDGTTLLDSRKIIGAKRHDPRFFTVKKNPYGRIEMLIQRPGFTSGARVPVPGVGFFERRLDPQSVIFTPNVSPLTVYGQPDTWAITQRLKDRANLIESAVIAARNHANPPLFFTYQSNPEIKESPDDIAKQLSAMKRVAKKQETENSKWIFGAGKGEHKLAPVGYNALPDITSIIEHVTACAIIACGLNPASLGFSLGKSGVTSFESSDKMLVNAIVQKQRAICSALMTKLYPMMQTIEQECPEGEIIVRMKEPTAESMKERYEADAILVNNVERRWRNGSLTADAGARMLGEDEIQDKEQFDKWLNSTEVEPNQNDPNATQSVDKAVRSVSKNGKSPSNNPSGRRESINGNVNGKPSNGFAGRLSTD